MRFRNTALTNDVQNAEPLVVKPAQTKFATDRPLPEEGWKSAGCTRGRHSTCNSLRCSCQCHKKLPV